MSHITINPAIHYWGTPVVLLSTLNPDLTPNLAPMSAAFWLGNRCMLGLARGSHTTENLLRTRQVVLNLPSSTPQLVSAINALSRTTGSTPVPAFKVALGYRYEKDKFGAAGLTEQESEAVKPPRVRECPVQLECGVAGVYEMMGDEGVEEGVRGFAVAVEVKILRTHVMGELRMEGRENRVDPDRWRPVIMSFQQLYGLGEGRFGGGRGSRLGEIEEELYRMPAEEPEGKVKQEKVEEYQQGDQLVRKGRVE